MYMCIVKDAVDHVRNPSAVFVDGMNCPKLGRKLAVEDEDQTMLKHYPLQNILFYTQIPHFKEQVMAREFEFLLADLGVHFTSSNYIKEAIGEKHAIHFLFPNTIRLRIEASFFFDHEDYDD